MDVRVRCAGTLTVIIEQDSTGYYVATVPELRGCHTQAKS
jgi:predicted RNase H-like HicB family nuclease